MLNFLKNILNKDPKPSYLVKKSIYKKHLPEAEIAKRQKHTVSPKVISQSLGKIKNSNKIIDLRYMKITSEVMNQLPLRQADNGKIIVEGATYHN